MGKVAYKEVIVRNVPVSIHTALKIKAAKEGTTIQDICLKLIKDGFKRKRRAVHECGSAHKED